MNIGTVEKEVKSHLAARLGEHSYKLWIDRLRFATKGDHIICYCPNAYTKNRIQERYGDKLKAAVLHVTNSDLRPLLEVDPERKAPEPAPVSGRAHPPQLEIPGTAVRPAGQYLRPDQTFDSFVVGDSNDFAFSASLALASRKSKNVNALFLLSKHGLGKTHLARSIGHHVIAKFPMERVFYITADDFSSEMVKSFRDNSMEQFKAKYRKRCDVLMIEDVHQLTGKERTQTELALTFDHLYDAGKKLIFSSCYLPADIPKLSDKLRSLLNVGIITHIEKPEYGHRVRILEHKAKANGYSVPGEIIDLLAADLTRDIRQLESGLTGVVARASLTGQPIDLDLAQGVISYIAKRGREITPKVIKKFVCKHFQIGESDIVSIRRKKHLVTARQVAMYLARIYTDLPLGKIGDCFNRNHATVLYSITSAERRIRDDREFRRAVEYLTQKLEG